MFGQLLVGYDGDATDTCRGERIIRISGAGDSSTPLDL